MYPAMIFSPMNFCLSFVGGFGESGQRLPTFYVSTLLPGSFGRTKKVSTVSPIVDKLLFMSKSVSETISSIIEPIILSMGIELVEVEFKKEQAGWILRVFIDREGGIRLQDCELVSREIEPVLDAEDPVIQTFTLEVSSPGLQRPLKKPEDFERFRGKLVKIKLYVPLDGEKTFCAHILQTEGDDLILDRKGQSLRVSFAKIAKANLEVEW